MSRRRQIHGAIVLVTASLIGSACVGFAVDDYEGFRGAVVRARLPGVGPREVAHV